MPSGYEDYVVYKFTNPDVALQRAQAHLTFLHQQMTTGRVAADGVSYDPSTIGPVIDRVEKDIVYLVGRVHGIGKPRMIPTRRADPWPVPGTNPY